MGYILSTGSYKIFFN